MPTEGPRLLLRYVCTVGMRFFMLRGTSAVEEQHVLRSPSATLHSSYVARNRRE